jgi:hypothetical protein
VLTDKDMSMLEKCIPRFRAADPNRRENIVEKAADRIKSTWTVDIEFDRDTVISVCELSAKLDCAEIFLAYSRVSIRHS